MSDVRVRQARFERMYRSHADAIRAYARLRLASAPEAEDVTQQTMLVA